MAADILELSLVFHDYINQLYYSSTGSELNGNSYDNQCTFKDVLWIAKQDCLIKKLPPILSMLSINTFTCSHPSVWALRSNERNCYNTIILWTVESTAGLDTQTLASMAVLPVHHHSWQRDPWGIVSLLYESAFIQTIYLMLQLGFWDRDTCKNPFHLVPVHTVSLPSCP